MKSRVYKHEALVPTEMMGTPENTRTTNLRNFSIPAA
jgi:hypothetical protein